jgi:hypothetical protein
MTPNGYVTDGRIASVRPPTPTFCLLSPFARELCARPLLLHCCLALLLCFFPIVVSRFFSPSRGFKTGSYDFFFFSLE